MTSALLITENTSSSNKTVAEASSEISPHKIKSTITTKNQPDRDIGRAPHWMNAREGARQVSVARHAVEET